MPPMFGEALEDPGDDDYVAQVLAREARENSLKYSTQGLGAYMPKRPTSGAPKPNMRFLRNIIRDTDSHNAALRRKEEKEARDRIRHLQTRPSSPSQVSRVHDNHHHSGRTGSKRKEREEREDRHHRSHRRRHRSRSGSEERESGRERRRRHKHDGIDADRSSRHDRLGIDEHYRSRHGRSYLKSRSRSPRGERGHRSHRHRHRHGHLSRHSTSPSPKRTKSHRYHDKDGIDRHGRRSSRERHRDGRRSEDGNQFLSTSLQDNLPEEESDPLEDLIGPIPPNMNGLDDVTLRSRGRGAYKTNTSNIDEHFAPDYNPTLDVHAGEDDDDTNTVNRPSLRPVPGLMTGEDDWDLALEALRDRARWRQKGEERLREAGFNENVVERWKNDAAFTTGTGDTEEVTWSKKGEGREWDRGKVIGADGHVDVKAPW